MTPAELRAENIYRASLGLPSSVLRARTDLLPVPSAEAPHYLYPVAGEHESLDDRVLDDLIRRVQKLEQMMAAQEEVIRNLVAWRFSHSPRAPGSTQALVQGETEPQGQAKPGQGRGTW